MRNGKPRPSRHGRTSAPKSTWRKSSRPQLEKVFDIGIGIGELRQQKRDQARLDDLAALAESVGVLLHPEELVSEVEQYLRDAS